MAVLLIVTVRWITLPAPGVQDRILLVAHTEYCSACRWSDAVLCMAAKGPKAGVHPVEEDFLS